MTAPAPALRPRPRCMVRVVVHDKGDERAVIHDREGDHNYEDFREWIIHTSYWAMRNGKTVWLEPLD
jgi:hypothetical protein